ncbi:MAG TPA: hypothetical protein VHW65_12225 [Gemmatimonadales bacterium]|jgi:hypothetical protein|nr:hypothetical protein [Gemmatimonadales bacterium]
MRPRTEAAVAVALLAALVAVAAVLGNAHNTEPSADRRTSTFIAGPGGSRALLDGAQRLGIAVRRFRERSLELSHLPPTGDRDLLAIIDPTIELSPPDLSAIIRFRRADLLLVGAGASTLMRCFGYEVSDTPFDSARAVPRGSPATAHTPWVHATLKPTRLHAFVDTSRTLDLAAFSCAVPAYRAIDTLLVTTSGKLVAIAVHPAHQEHSAILVADGDLFRNQQLRTTDAGPFALGLMAGHYDRVIFEEYHHGFGASGSLIDATLEWTEHSPWGWFAWQLAAVGALALLFGAVRFGPAVPPITPVRRSPLEHVRALATALSAAHGQDEAIAAIVRGLRRRLQPPGLRSRGDWRAWVAQLGQRARTPAQENTVATLARLTQPGQPAASVLQAANTVEDLWQQLRP